jgi:hypothetical protein
MVNELLLKAHVMALDLSEAPRREQPALLSRLCEQAYVEEALLVNAEGLVLATARREPQSPEPPAPSPQALRDARQVRGYGAVEPVGDKGLLLRVIVSLENPGGRGEARYLQLTPGTTYPRGAGESVQVCAYKGCRCRARG